jgi:uncharacterized surface protein with fasciclin (FAS1) repeats
MRKKALFLFIALITAVSLNAGSKNPIVGGQEMLPSLNVVENLAKSADHTTFVAALKAAGLDETLRGAGPYTVFAPINQAFAELPKGTMENLMKPENREQLKQMLSYHIVAGKFTTADIKNKIKEGNGPVELTSLQGSKLTLADHNGMHLMVRDEDDDIGMFNVSDVLQSNGVVHVIDNVMQPKN